MSGNISVPGAVGSTQLEPAAAGAPCWGRTVQKSTRGTLIQVQRCNLGSVAIVLRGTSQHLFTEPTLFHSLQACLCQAAPYSSRCDLRLQNGGRVTGHTEGPHSLSNQHAMEARCALSFIPR